MSRTKEIFAALIAALFAAAATHAEDPTYRQLTLDGFPLKWGAPNRGATITYAVAEYSSSLRGKENCRHTTGVSALLTHSQLRTEQFHAALTSAFQLWSEAADVHFEPAAPGARPDLTVTAEAEPDGIAFTDVRHRSGAITQAIICLNPKAAWTAENRPDIADAYRLTYVLAHEIGHAIGLDHPSPEGQLMSFEYDRARQGLQPGDVNGVVSLYGKPRPHGSLASRY